MAKDVAIQLEVVTPKGMTLQAEVDEVIAPSVEGQFGVLPGHLPLMAAMSTGLLSFRQGDKIKQAAVGSGFVEVHHDATLVLTDRYVTKDEVDVLAVRERLVAVDEELEGWDGELNDAHRLELIEEEQWLAAQLELIGDPPVPKILETSRGVDFAELMPPTPDAADEEPAPGDEGES